MQECRRGLELIGALAKFSLLLLVVLVVIQAFLAWQHCLITLALLGLTVFLAVLGLRSGNLRHPAEVMDNLDGASRVLKSTMESHSLLDRLQG